MFALQITQAIKIDKTPQTELNTLSNSFTDNGVIPGYEIELRDIHCSLICDGTILSQWTDYRNTYRRRLTGID